LAGLQKILPQLTAKGATIVGISVDEAPESRMLRGTLKLEFPLLHDEDARVASAYGVRMLGESMAIPSLFVVTHDGTIVWRHIGEYVPDRPTPESVLEAIDGRHHEAAQPNPGSQE
jgi:peroxiredoxin